MTHKRHRSMMSLSEYMLDNDPENEGTPFCISDQRFLALQQHKGTTYAFSRIDSVAVT